MDEGLFFQEIRKPQKGSCAFNSWWRGRVQAHGFYSSFFYIQKVPSSEFTASPSLKPQYKSWERPLIRLLGYMDHWSDAIEGSFTCSTNWVPVCWSDNSPVPTLEIKITAGLKYEGTDSPLLFFCTFLTFWGMLGKFISKENKAVNSCKG